MKVFSFRVDFFTAFYDSAAQRMTMLLSDVKTVELMPLLLAGAGYRNS